MKSLNKYIGDAIGGFIYYHSSHQLVTVIAPYRYDVVDSAFCDWKDVESLVKTIT